MLRRPVSIIAIAALAAALSACASSRSTPLGGSLSDYVGVSYVNVTTTCGGGYQIYRQPTNGRMLVAAYAASEVRQSICQSWRGESSVSPVTGVRHEEAVTEYIAATPALKGCTVVSGVAITRLHSEFSIACPAAPGAATISAKG
jgi:hypothetical protein